jgi:hypothetical protein
MEDEEDGTMFSMRREKPFLVVLCVLDPNKTVVARCRRQHQRAHHDCVFAQREVV